MPSKQIFSRILFPTDGSVSSLVGQELAIVIAKGFNSRVIILHAVPSRSASIPAEGREYVATGLAGPIIAGVPAPSETHLPGGVSSDIDNWFQKTGERIISEAAAVFREEDIAAESKLVESADPAEAIINEAEEGKYNLVVLGYSGQEEQKPHLGSVAKKVSQHVKTSVLIARERSQISKMLVPVDGSKNAGKALRYASVLAKQLNAQISLLHVQESGLVKLRPELAKEMGNRILSDAADQVKGIALHKMLISGDPAKTIIQEAANGDYDLIVLGRKGHSVIRRFLLGSVSDHVIHYADRSVLLVR